MSRNLKPCGTRAAYARHLSKKEEVCQECLIVNTNHQKAIRLKKGMRQTKTIAECGTISGYLKHKRLKEDSCDLCRDSINEYQSKNNKKKNKDKKMQDLLNIKIKIREKLKFAPNEIKKLI